jgi:DnaK suppressor protein
MQKKATPATTAKSAKDAAKTATGGPRASTAAKSAKKHATAKAAPVKAPAAKKHAATPARAPEATPGPAGSTSTVTKHSAAQPHKEDSKKVAVKKAEATATKKAVGGAKPKIKADRAAFFAEQRELLLEERRSYMSSAEALKAQADSLALEHEPGDVQFDEEGGEGGTANVDREIDLYLSAQARATVVEIDRALQKIEDGTYGSCEQCGDAIPDARLQALPYAALCITCKSGGLSSRR